MKHMCPVCGYADLKAAPQDYEICPSCGTEFGLDDSERTHEELRKAWIASGAHWFSDRTRPPSGWNATEQLADADMLPYEVVSEAQTPTIQPIVYLKRKGASLYKRG